MDIVIIGGGVASVEAAIGARAQDAEASITILSAEEVMPYRRPALSRMLFEELTDAQFFLKSKDFYQEKRITLKLNTEVECIDQEHRLVLTSAKESFHFDKLLLATGSRAWIPPINRVDKTPLRVLRSYADMQEIKRLEATTAVILGGGLLGLELAEGLLKRNFNVRVIEMCNRLLPKQLDATGSQILQAKLSNISNLQIITGECASQITSTGVKLESGTLVPGSVFFAASGARACTNLARCAQIKVGHGIKVDEYLQTSAPGIYAAGDNTEINGVSWGLFNPAMAMGKIAGNNLTGTPKKFIAQSIYPARLNAFGLKLFSAGCPECEGIDYSTPDNYLKLFFKDNKLSGAILLGDITLAPTLQNAIEQHLLRPEVEKLL